MKEIEKAVKLELYNFVVQIMCINKEQCKYFEAKENNKYYPFVDSEIREAIRFLEIQSFKDMLLQFLDTRQRCWEKRNCTPKDKLETVERGEMTEFQTMLIILLLIIFTGNDWED